MYGGKLVAAMDRQHPRDLFDVLQLFEHEGITAGIRRAFVVYLASHNRPVHEVLFPSLRDIRKEYENDFEGMTEEPVALKTLACGAREDGALNFRPVSARTSAAFYCHWSPQSPNTRCWGEHLEQLPGLRWKLQNLGQLRRANPKKFAAQSDALAKLLA